MEKYRLKKTKPTVTIKGWLAPSARRQTWQLAPIRCIAASWVFGRFRFVHRTVLRHFSTGWFQQKRVIFGFKIVVGLGPPFQPGSIGGVETIDIHWWHPCGRNCETIYPDLQNLRPPLQRWPGRWKDEDDKDKDHQSQQQPNNQPTNQPTNQPNKQTNKQTNNQTKQKQLQKKVQQVQGHIYIYIEREREIDR